MLAENLENLIKRERLEAHRAGQREGHREGQREALEETARNLIKLGVLTDQQIAQATSLPLSEVRHLREVHQH